MQVKRALISVTNKDGIAEFGKKLTDLGIEILTTGGTGKVLAGADVPFTEIASETGFPEILGGRLKTLHPKIHGGILYRRDLESDVTETAEHQIRSIDIVIVNLYDFAGKTAGGNVSDSDAVEAIDIGGPTMIRSAAKNFAHVAVITSPERYEDVIDSINEKGTIEYDLRRALSGEAFEHTAQYDRMIADWFASDESKVMPEKTTLSLSKRQELRYGENPQQDAAFYTLASEEDVGIATCEQLHGKALSFNNLIDADIALSMPYEFEKPAVAILKHTTPSGVAQADTIAEAEALARGCDPVSAFGGIVGMNRECDAETAKQINKAFTEVIVAPAYTEEALAILRKKKNLRLLKASAGSAKRLGWDMRRISGGILLQGHDAGFDELDNLKIVTERQPSAEELEELRFAWIACKYVKSNAVLFSRGGQTIGIGAGQMSRVDAVRLAKLKAADSKLDLKGSVLASDAFFPFPDGLEQAAEAGAVAIIQPGGSVRDQEVIDAANRLGVAMVLTGTRHFRHA